MKKNVISVALVLALVLPAFVKAESHLSSNFSVASNYVFRGLSYNSQGTTYNSQGQPVVQGSVDYIYNSDFVNLGASFFAGPADTFNTQSYVMERDTEADTFLTASNKINDNFSCGLGYNYYSFMKNVDNDSTEWTAFFNYKKFNLINGYTDRFSGVDTNQNRTVASIKPELKKNISLDLRVGYNNFCNPTAVATSNYYDYLTGLVFTSEGFTFEVAYTNTINRINLINNQYSKTDGTFTVSLSKNIEVF